MFNPKLRRLPLAAAALAACVGAHAEYASPDGNFSLSGFGTLGYARSSTDDALYNYRGQGGGADKNGSLGTDTKAAIQGTYRIAPTLQATAQVLSKLRPEGDYSPGVEWAFAKWQALPSLSFRAGRMGVPFFMLSDFRDVNYAVTAVRPSMDVYGQVPVSNFDGGDVSYQMNLGGTTLTSSVWMGGSRTTYALDLPQNRPPSDLKILKQVGLNVLAEWENGLSLRFGHVDGKLSVTSAGTKDVINGATAFKGYASSTAIANQYQTVIDGLSVSGKDASFTGIGFNYDEGNWVASGEYTKRKTKSYISDTDGMYGLIGYRFGKFTPYFSASRIKTTRRDTTTAAPTASCSNLSAGVAAAYACTTDPKRTILTQMGSVYYGTRFIIDTQKVDERTNSIGVRWDAKTGVAVKAQFDRISKPADAGGLFMVPLTTTVTTGNSWVNNPRSVNILSVSVDYVF